MALKSTTLFGRLCCRLKKSPSRFSKEEALDIARLHNLENEIMEALRHGYSPDEALEDWDIYPYT